MKRLGQREAVRFHNGFRTWKCSYQQLHSRICGFSHYLDQQGFQKGDRILLWGGNRIEWVVAFWGCLAQGIQVVPADLNFSSSMVRRIQRDVRAKLLVHGDQVGAHEIDIPKLSFRQMELLPPWGHLETRDVSPTDIVEIVYTSGTTAEPKGVIHRHNNVWANLKPFQKEIRKYQIWLRPFGPIRILNLLPMSHMYGQFLGIFLPLFLEGTVVFMEELSPTAIIQSIRREGVSVLVSVPRLVMSLEDQLGRTFDLAGNGIHGSGLVGVAQRWWHYRQVHRILGWKFWSIVVGGAHLNSGTEAFWRRLGFLVLQGYGLTETSPVVTVNHPFKARQGSIGQVLPGQEVKISPDGEILVRGDSVADEYLGSNGPEELCRDGWLHTGDLGELDQEGFLYYRGRIKDLIVTSAGLNIHPQDVETVLNGFPEIHQSVVVGLKKGQDEEIHAALIVHPTSFDMDELIARANQQLESYQRIRSWSIWTEEEFPRTPSTLKIKRREVARRVLEAAQGDSPALPKSAVRGVKDLVAEIAGKEPSQLKKNQRLGEDLGLSSLDQIDLLSQLESQAGIELDEEQFTALRTIGEIDSWLQQKTSGAAATTGTPLVGAGPAGPHWNQFVAIRWLRRLVLELLILRIFKHFIGLRVEGLEHLEGLQTPVIFVANHVSHLDTPALLAALPNPWRWRLAPAMAQGFFRTYFHPQGASLKERVLSASQYLLACGLFNAYPLPQEAEGLRQSVQYMGWLIEQGNCPLVYPEGKRSPDGGLLPFQSGIGFMARRLQMAVVPVHLEGLHGIYSVHHKWPQSGEVQVRIGSALHFGAEQDYKEITKEIEAAVKALELEQLHD